MGLRPKPPAAASGDPVAPRGITWMGLRPKPPAAASGDPVAPRGITWMGLRPKPPAAASGDPVAPRGITWMGLRPKPPAAASGDPVAPRRGRRAAPCAAWGSGIATMLSPRATFAGRVICLGATRGFTTGS